MVIGVPPKKQKRKGGQWGGYDEWQETEHRTWGTWVNIFEHPSPNFNNKPLVCVHFYLYGMSCYASIY